MADKIAGYYSCIQIMLFFSFSRRVKHNGKPIDLYWRMLKDVNNLKCFHAWKQWVVLVYCQFMQIVLFSILSRRGLKNNCKSGDLYLRMLIGDTVWIRERAFMHSNAMGSISILSVSVESILCVFFKHAWSEYLFHFLNMDVKWDHWIRMNYVV